MSETRLYYVPTGRQLVEGNPLTAEFTVEQHRLVFFSFSQALAYLKGGLAVSRQGFTKNGEKWVRLNPGNATTLSYLELVYPEHSAAHYAGQSVPWLPSRCDLLEADWYVHPLAPENRKH